jgi:hypothetical protein
MTTDELIDLVARRDRISAELSDVRRELDKQRVRHGYYIGSNGQCLHVTGGGEQPSQYSLVYLRKVLVPSSD